MNSTETKAAAEVMAKWAKMAEEHGEAYANSKMQWMLREAGGPWENSESVNAPVWNWKHFDYRIKPEPREWWIVEHALDNGNQFSTLYASQTSARADAADEKPYGSKRTVIHLHDAAAIATEADNLAQKLKSRSPREERL